VYALPFIRDFNGGKSAGAVKTYGFPVSLQGGALPRQPCRCLFDKASADTLFTVVRMDGKVKYPAVR
jgi:hypothetical protein